MADIEISLTEKTKLAETYLSQLRFARADLENLQEGIEMISKKLWKMITCEGLCPIEALTKPFDPHKHEAVLEIETCECPEGMVVQEIRKGYLLNGEVFRPSLVNVSCSPSSVKIKKR